MVGERPLWSALVDAGHLLAPSPEDRRGGFPVLDARRLLVWQPGLAARDPEPPETAAPLGLSEARNPQNRVHRYGSKGLTANGRKQVQRAAELLQEMIGQVAFWTVTLPDASIRQLVTEDRWHLFQTRIRDLLCRRLKRAGMIPLVVGVVELHPARSMRDRLPLPHLHVLFHASRQRWRGWVLNREVLDRIIADACRYAGIEPPDTRAAGNVQPVKRNAGAYLSKYLIKSRRPEVLAQAGGHLPRVWWFWSGPMRTEVAATTVRLCWGFVRWLSQLGEREAAQLGWEMGQYEMADERARTTFWAKCRSPSDLQSTQTYFLHWRDLVELGNHPGL